MTDTTLPGLPERAEQIKRPDGVRATIVAGLLASAALVLGLGVWAGGATLAGAVIAGGTVVVESAVKKVQHQTGGIVGEILVRNGDRVEPNQLMIRLDETRPRADLEIVNQALDRADIRMARLEAERIGAEEMTIPARLQSKADNPEIAGILSGEQALFKSRKDFLVGQRRQAEERIAQYRQQIVGLKAQQAANLESLKLTEEDFATVSKLYEKKLVSLDRISALRLNLARLQGEAGRLTAAIAETDGRISEMRIQAEQMGEDMRKEANTDLRETEGKRAELLERKLVAEDQLARTEIRAPQAGYVQQLAFHTVGGVIGPGEPIMLLVPVNDDLVIDARVPPTRIDDIAVGQAVRVRFPAFDMATTPECHGKVARMSADLLHDQQQNISYYEARVTVDDEKACLTDRRTLIPGMPAELYIQTGERSVWSYLFKPILDQLARAFKE